MKIFKLLFIVSLLYAAAIFTACGTTKKESEKKNETGLNAGSDSTPQASRDSIAKGTTVTPTSATTTPKN